MKANKPVDNKKYVSELRLILIAYLVSQDWSHADIARTFNVHRSVINRIIKKHQDFISDFQK